MKDLIDEIPAIALGLANLFQARHHSSGIGVAPSLHKSFFVILIETVVRVWEEKGGSMKDESEMLESMFSNPDPDAKSAKLTPKEQKKVSAVLKEMTPAEQKIFRIALFLMDPEVVTIETPGKQEKKDKDGKVIQKATEPTKRTERSGVDSRVNVLRGIAAHVKADFSNATEVATMLRDVGALGSNNEALNFLQKVQTELKKLLCTLLSVESVEDITMSLVYDKLVGEVEDGAPIPMGPIRYLINSVMMGKDNAKLVLIPPWIKNRIKNLKKPSLPRLKSRRPPLEDHERIPPTF